MGLVAMRAAETTLRADAAKTAQAGPAARQTGDRAGALSCDRLGADFKAAPPAAGDGARPARSPELVLLASVHALATEGMEHDSSEWPPSRFATRHLLDGGQSFVDYDFQGAISDLRGRLERIARATSGSGHERLVGIHGAAARALAAPGWDPGLTEAEKLVRYKELAAAILDVGRASDLPAPDQVIETLCRQVSDAEQAVASVAARREPLRKRFLEAQAAAGAVPLWKKCLGFGFLQAMWYQRTAARLADQLSRIEGLERDAHEALDTARGVREGATRDWKLADAEQLARHAASIGAQVTSVAHRAMAAVADLQ